MRMDKEAQRIQFKDWIDFIKKDNNKKWIKLYKSIKEDNENLVIYSCLIKKNYVTEALKDYTWDFHITDISASKNVFPLLVKRHFYGIKKDYWEITEDIIYFFNLFEEGDKNDKKFSYIDNNGDVEEVILISDTEVKIKNSFIKEYLYDKGLVLVQFFDLFRYSKKSINDLRLKKINRERKGGNHIYHQVLTDDSTGLKDKKLTASLIGKKIISPTNSFKPEIFNEKKEYEEFIIGVDKDGKKQYFTCNEEKLKNFFGANKNHPHYLTPVYFKKKVLDKYYNHPAKYSVSDGYLKCGSLWELRIDNSHKDHVMVFLGDLGHILDKEQKHWKQYNIIDGKMSHTAFKRNFEAKFCDPEVADLLFKQKFRGFQKQWHKKHGWYLFLPLSSEDKHNYKTLRLPTKQSQQEFDSLIQSLTKLTVDSLNEKKLKENLIKDTDEDKLKNSIKKEFILITDKDKRDRKIDIFRKYLAQEYNLQFPELFEFLKDLQKLRSAGSAHRKSRKKGTYQNIKRKFGLDENNFIEVFEKILIRFIWVLNTLSDKKYNLI